MSRISKVPIHKFVFDGSRFDVVTKVYNHKHKRFWDIIKENRGKMEDRTVPLPITKVSKIIGCYKGKLRNMNFRPEYTPDYLAKHFLQKEHEPFNEWLQDKLIKVFPGSWKYNSQNLVDMATDHKVKYTVEQIIDGYFSRANVDLVLPRLNDIKPEYILGMKTKRDSYPGILTAESFGSARRNTIKFTKPMAKEYMNTIMDSKEQILDCSYLYVGGREKRMVANYGEKKVCKTRVTLGQEDIPTLISTTLSKMLNEGFQKMDKGFNYGGRVNGRLNYRDLSDELKIDDRYQLNFNVDFSGHDNNISQEALIASFAILRMCFKPSKRIDRLFYYVMSGMIFKRIVLPESRIIYQISKGLATGHGMTNIINTLCSYGTFATAMNNTCSRREILSSKLVMAGDDVMGRMLIRSIRKVSSDMKRHSGMIMDDIVDTSSCMNSLNSRIRNTFLKKKYILNGISWNEVELFTNLSFPTSNKLRVLRKVDNYLQMSRQAPFDQLINNTMKNLIIIQFIDALIDEFYLNGKKQCAPPLFNNMWRMINNHDKLQVMDYGWVKESYDVRSEVNDGDTQFMLKKAIDDAINNFNQVISRSSSWFLIRRHFKAMESNTRLRVFDFNKTYIAPAQLPNKSIVMDRLHNIIKHHDTHGI